MEKMLRTRTILLSGEVNKPLAERVVRQLVLLEDAGDEPIKVFIDSPGGDVDAGYAILDMMRFVKPDVYTIGMGLVASAGALILLASPKDAGSACQQPLPDPSAAFRDARCGDRHRDPRARDRTDAQRINELIPKRPASRRAGREGHRPGLLDELRRGEGVRAHLPDRHEPLRVGVDGRSEEPGMLQRLPGPRGSAPMTFSQGKVRDVFYFDDELVISTSDRISAFDRILGEVPLQGRDPQPAQHLLVRQDFGYRGEPLSRDRSLRGRSSRASARRPVEVVVRGYLTGSAWRDYRATGRSPGSTSRRGCGSTRSSADTPLITPSTKEADGLHDRPCSRDEVLEPGVVDETVWAQIEEKAIALYERGRDRRRAGAHSRGHEIRVRSRRRRAPPRRRAAHARLVALLVRRHVRRALRSRREAAQARQGVPAPVAHGAGLPGRRPATEDSREVFFEVSRRYQQAFEAITGAEFRTQTTSSEAEKQKVLSFLAERQDDA